MSDDTRDTTEVPTAELEELLDRVDGLNDTLWENGYEDTVRPIDELVGELRGALDDE